ncbi:hypothetical protein H696_05550 [Fonticula alba]|uniref:Protein-serine/threonine kinase n=1 Tax=Fonticula alba TaxID=691883 RepID=A0A058Z1K4_FONAL|nr:hypothetical protein H696_05550 [Fonticula alba]KCV67818.1 hypothetical protein H696_05550 [Fonticula alba]|eukprot:XP_009497638.1 hypothetical protein H696_05550 [Fonticula alba]
MYSRNLASIASRVWPGRYDSIRPAGQMAALSLGLCQGPDREHPRPAGLAGLPVRRHHTLLDRWPGFGQFAPEASRPGARPYSAATASSPKVGAVLPVDTIPAPCVAAPIEGRSTTTRQGPASSSSSHSSADSSGSSSADSSGPEDLASDPTLYVPTDPHDKYEHLVKADPFANHPRLELPLSSSADDPVGVASRLRSHGVSFAGPAAAAAAAAAGVTPHRRPASAHSVVTGHQEVTNAKQMPHFGNRAWSVSPSPLHVYGGGYGASLGGGASSATPDSASDSESDSDVTFIQGDVDPEKAVRRIRRRLRALRLADIDPVLADKIRHYASFPQRSVTLRQMAEFGAWSFLILSASENGEALYSETLHDLSHDCLPDNVAEVNDRFVELIDKIKNRHNLVMTSIAEGIIEWKRSHRQPIINSAIQSFLDQFFMARIGIRFLIGQHIALSRPESLPAAHGGPGGGRRFVGMIMPHMRVSEIIDQAISDAQNICEAHFDLFTAPPIVLSCDPDLTLTYVPSHLHYMIFEILKNSLRAVVERHGGPEPWRLTSDQFPPITITVVRGQEDVTIRVSDQGGGIPRSGLRRVWTYLYTTAAEPPAPGRGYYRQAGDGLDPAAAAADGVDASGAGQKTPMAGFGYGLPLARLYSRYLNGDLRIVSMDGEGTDIYIHLPLKATGLEPLP